MKWTTALLRLERLLLAIYLMALFGLLMSPIAVPGFHLLGIGADKWMHVALFGGLAIFLRWNRLADRYATTISVCVAFIVVVIAELAQSFVSYRSAELWDIAAGLVGALLGAVSMNRVVSAGVPERTAGLLVALLGLMIAMLFVLADLIGIGDSKQFGTLQIGGAVLGVLIGIGGIGVYMCGSPKEPRR